MNLRTIATLGTVVFLSACAATYTLDGKKYSSDEVQPAADQLFQQTRQQVVSEMRVPAPISKKTLTVGVPSLDALKPTIRSTGTPQQAMQDNLILTTRKELLMFGETIKGVGIYQDVKIVDTTGGHLQPSSTDSVLYYFVVPAGGQWYINGGKAGMQTVNIDRGQPDFLGKAKSYVNSVKGYALTD